MTSLHILVSAIGGLLILLLVFGLGGGEQGAETANSPETTSLKA
jgi:hypothetical protein